ncbi:Uma2 family endonuclease [Leptolyngbya sp. AN03gr2]|uniref:Uma2 family endonuclease n=1 Tax=unclassified Leptolyngbya TaxID=2650499 RepID=UPI003D321A87
MELTNTLPKTMTVEDLPRMKWSIEEYHELIKYGLLNDKKVELLCGEIIEMVPEGEDHVEQNEDGYKYIDRLLGDRARVRKAAPITLPNGSEPEPDIAICQPLGREYRQHHPYPENILWLIEYSNSTLKKDLEIKSKIYAEVGIQEYWIVKIQTNELIVMRNPENGEYQTELLFRDGVICPIAFPSVEVEVLKVISP